MTILKLFLITLLVSGGFMPANASDTQSLELTVLAAVESRYAGRSFSAEFVQTSTLTALDISETATGKAWFSHPGKMKWQYLFPERHDIVTNGTTLWIFRPDENQVMQGDAAQFFQSGGGGAFLSDISLIRKNHTVSVTAVKEEWVELLLEDSTGNPDIQSIIIRASRPDFHIFSVTTVNAVGDTTRFDLSDIQFQPMPDDWFDFTVPSGVSIIEMD